MFERDKEELRGLGVPVERAPIDAWGSQEAYSIDYGMPELDLAPDERAALAQDGAGWDRQQLGNEVLVERLPGLLGPDGTPVNPRSPQGKLLVAKVKQFSQELLMNLNATLLLFVSFGRDNSRNSVLNS